MIGLPPSLAPGAIASRAGQAAPWGLAVWRCRRRTQCHAPLQPKHHSHDELAQCTRKGGVLNVEISHLCKLTSLCFKRGEISRLSRHLHFQNTTRKEKGAQT